MIANNTGEVIESDEYGEAVFHAVDDNMDEQDFSGMNPTQKLLRLSLSLSLWLDNG